MSKQLSKVYLIAILLISSGLITVFLRPADIISDTPIYTDDYSLHLSECISAKRFLSTAGKCWGYDPFLLAGFPRGALVNADNKAWELWYTAFSRFIGSGRAFKLYVIIFLLCYPFLTYLAARNFNLTREISITAAILAVFFFNLSLPAAFVSYGMVSYVFACFFSLYILALFYKLFEGMTVRRYLCVCLLLALLLNIHILSTFHILIPIAILYLMHARRISLQRHSLIWLIPCIGLVINSYWLVPLFKFVSYKTLNPDTWNFTLQNRNVLEPLQVYILQRKSQFYTIPELNNTFMDIVLLLFGVLGFYCWKQKKLQVLWLPFAGGVIGAFMAAFYGSFTTFFPQFQPERFNIALSLLLIIPASVGVFTGAKELFCNRSRRAQFFIACLLFAFLYRPLLRPLGIVYRNKPYRLMCQVPGQFLELVSFLKNNTNNEGRILIEDSEYSKESYIHEYFGGHFPALFPEYLKREYLCGPRPMYPIQHAYASFTRGVLFEKKLATYTAEELRRMFDTYNVRWIVCWYGESKKFFERFPDYIIKIGNVDKFIIYEVKRRPSFFIKGEGTVNSDYNRLELKDIVPEDNELIISYHWMENFKAQPEVAIEKVLMAGDPIGFIKIKNPPSSLVIATDY
jgi:hypothetical protein